MWLLQKSILSLRVSALSQTHKYSSPSLTGTRVLIFHRCEIWQVKKKSWKTKACWSEGATLMSTSCLFHQTLPSSSFKFRALDGIGLWPGLWHYGIFCSRMHSEDFQCHVAYFCAVCVCTLTQQLRITASYIIGLIAITFISIVYNIAQVCKYRSAGGFQ